jgi:hypothetical protein
MSHKPNSVVSAASWRAASQAARTERAERLRLPSGAMILAARPEPLEWILAGRLPQQLLAIALDNSPAPTGGTAREIRREEILDLARFAVQLVMASVVEPRIGNGPDEIPLDEIPLEDRAFIFEWACRALSATPEGSNSESPSLEQEDHAIPSADGIERFRQK